MSTPLFRAIVCLALTLAAGTVPAFAQAGHSESVAQVPFTISLVPGVSIAEAVADGRATETNMSFTFFGGRIDRLQGLHYGGLWQRYTGEVNGLSSGAIVTIAESEVYGIQSSYIVNINRRPFSGAQSAGIINKNSGAFHGAQAAGILNIGADHVRGMQAAGIMNHATGPFKGAQAAGIFNYGPQQFRGFQSAGIMNHTEDSFSGFQWAGIVNCTGNFTGFQWAGIVNRAGVFNSGLQAAGIVNIANSAGHEVIQIAPVNIATHHEGIPIGPVSYVRDHGSALELWVDETAFVTTGFRTGNDRFYNIISLGAQAGDPTRWAVGWIFGAEKTVGKRTGIAFDAGIRHINEEGDTWTGGLNNQITVRLLGCRKITEHIALSAGPTLNYFRSSHHDGEELASWEIFEDTDNGKYHRIWPGFTFGLIIR